MSKLACITLDMEPDHGDPDQHIRLLENPEIYERYISLINKYNLKVTMFTVTSLFDKFGSHFNELGRRIPLELAPHSDRHDPYDACSPAEITAAENAFLKFTGKRPIGYRAPIGRINKEGLSHLMDAGYRYDASLYASMRPGEFGYFNLHMPNRPFKVTRGSDSLIEFPFTSVSTVRIVFGLSYVKLLGWGAYSTLLKLFGLPDIVVALSHPYDFYTHLVVDGLAGLEKFALGRNASLGFEYFENMVRVLQDRGYEFVFMSELYNNVTERTDLQQIALETWR
jgi:peptidoglycan/xylan/chitin deacetylase (PgdA/CDA1 family)